MWKPGNIMDGVVNNSWSDCIKVRYFSRYKNIEYRPIGSPQWIIRLNQDLIERGITLFITIAHK